MAENDHIQKIIDEARNLMNFGFFFQDFNEELLKFLFEYCCFCMGNDVVKLYPGVESYFCHKRFDGLWDLSTPEKRLFSIPTLIDYFLAIQHLYIVRGMLFSRFGDKPMQYYLIVFRQCIGILEMRNADKWIKNVCADILRSLFTEKSQLPVSVLNEYIKNRYVDRIRSISDKQLHDVIMDEKAVLSFLSLMDELMTVVTLDDHFDEVLQIIVPVLLSMNCDVRNSVTYCAPLISDIMTNLFDTQKPAAFAKKLMAWLCSRIEDSLLSLRAKFVIGRRSGVQAVVVSYDEDVEFVNRSVDSFYAILNSIQNKNNIYSAVLEEWLKIIITHSFAAQEEKQQQQSQLPFSFLLIESLCSILDTHISHFYDLFSTHAVDFLNVLRKILNWLLKRSHKSTPLTNQVAAFLLKFVGIFHLEYFLSQKDILETFQSVIRVVKIYSEKYPNSSIRATAAKLVANVNCKKGRFDDILQKCQEAYSKLSEEEQSRKVETFQTVMEDLNSTAVEIKGHALIMLRRLIENGDTHAMMALEKKSFSKHFAQNFGIKILMFIC
ncbi:Cytochrome P450 94B1 [Trichinella spiralis]|uniref:Cytochrome P450 94B1 n=1 Tax=Trichinella spiralis TaxID=6334 RepID=A0ABR3K480_TRISP